MSQGTDKKKVCRSDTALDDLPKPSYWSDEVLHGIKFAAGVMKNQDNPIELLEKVIEVGENIQWRVEQISELVDQCHEENSHDKNSTMFYRMLFDLYSDYGNGIVEGSRLDAEFCFDSIAIED